MGNAKLIVKLVKENEQLKEDALHYQTLFLEMENKVWKLEDALKELRGKIPENDKKLSASEPIIDLDDESIETLVPEQDCGD